MTNATITDPRPLFARAAATARATIAGIRPDQFAAPTPCAEFDVHGLVAHLLGVVARVATTGRGEDPMSSPDAVADVDDTEWLARWDAAIADLDAAWGDDATLRMPVVLPWASTDGAGCLVMWAGELHVHTWDLAKATGQAPAWDDEVATAGLASIQTMLPGPERTAMYEAIREQMGLPEADFHPPFGPFVATPDGAPTIDRLVAWMGRDPNWRP